MRQSQLPRQRPTVGDTLNIVHRVAVPPNALVQPRVPLDSMLATIVSVPQVLREGDSVRISYSIATWSPGRNQLTIPGPVVLYADGTVDTLPDSHVMLDVASVLPAGAAVESLTAKQARPWVERSEVTILPMALLLLPVLLLLLAVAFLWRRRGHRSRGSSVTGQPSQSHRSRVEQWIVAGEAALAVDHLAVLLPESEACNDWRERVQEIRFRPNVEDALGVMAQEGLQLLEGRGGTK